MGFVGSGLATLHAASDDVSVSFVGFGLGLVTGFGTSRQTPYFSLHSYLSGHTLSASHLCVQYVPFTQMPEVHTAGSQVPPTGPLKAGSVESPMAQPGAG